MKTLIFDFDGTIADSFDTLLGIFEEITGKHLTDQEIQQLRGESLKDIIKYLKLRRWQIPRIIIKAKRLLNIRMKNIKVFPGISNTLKQLHTDGYQLFVLSTNNSQNIAWFLKTNNIDYFSMIYGDIGLRSKSSALKKIIKKERLKHVDCVYIGDEMRDVEAAKKAGITSVGVTWGFNNAPAIKNSRPDFMAQKPTDLAKYLTS